MPDFLRRRPFWWLGSCPRAGSASAENQLVNTGGAAAMSRLLVYSHRRLYIYQAIARLCTGLGWLVNHVLVVC